MQVFKHISFNIEQTKQNINDRLTVELRPPFVLED